MSTAYEIPFEPRAQTFVIALAGVSYRLSTAWNVASSCWVLDVATPEGVAIVSAIPIVTGANLLEQFDHLAFGGKVFVQNVSADSLTPGYADLGVSGLAFFVVP